MVAIAFAPNAESLCATLLLRRSRAGFTFPPPSCGGDEHDDSLDFCRARIPLAFDNRSHSREESSPASSSGADDGLPTMSLSRLFEITSIDEKALGDAGPDELVRVPSDATPPPPSLLDTELKPDAPT